MSSPKISSSNNSILPSYSSSSTSSTSTKKVANATFSQISQSLNIHSRGRVCSFWNRLTRLCGRESTRNIPHPSALPLIAKKAEPVPQSCPQSPEPIAGPSVKSSSQASPTPQRRMLDILFSDSLYLTAIPLNLTFDAATNERDIKFEDALKKQILKLEKDLQEETSEHLSYQKRTSSFSFETVKRGLIADFTRSYLMVPGVAFSSNILIMYSGLLESYIAVYRRILKKHKISQAIFETATRKLESEKSVDGLRLRLSNLSGQLGSLLINNTVEKHSSIDSKEGSSSSSHSDTITPSSSLSSGVWEGLFFGLFLTVIPLDYLALDSIEDSGSDTKSLDSLREEVHKLEINLKEEEANNHHYKKLLELHGKKWHPDLIKDLGKSLMRNYSAVYFTMPGVAFSSSTFMVFIAFLESQITICRRILQTLKISNEDLERAEKELELGANADALKFKIPKLRNKLGSLLMENALYKKYLLEQHIDLAKAPLTERDSSSSSSSSSSSTKGI